MAEAMQRKLEALVSELDAAKMDNNKRVIELRLARDALETFRRGAELRQKDLAEAGKQLAEKDDTIDRLGKRVSEIGSALERTRLELCDALRLVDRLENPVLVVNHNSDKQRQLREQADAWIAVHDQLYRPDKNCTNLDIPSSCARNIAIRMIRELQRKAAILDRINAGDFR